MAPSPDASDQPTASGANLAPDPATGRIPVGTTEPHLSAPGFRMFDRGAHVTHWRPGDARHPVLYSSSLARIGPGTAWRGGIPICAPWFASGPDGARTPSHGPARTAMWLREAETAGGTHHALTIDVDASGAPALLELEYTTKRSDRSLEVALTITNTGRDAALVEAALHTYLAVSDVQGITVRGLENAAFFDKAADADVGPGAPLEFGELVDRVYDDAASVVEINDTEWSRRLIVERYGATKAVVWNPGPSAPADVGEGEWRAFVCVEAAIAGDRAVTLAPDQSHCLATTVVAHGPG
ncbi:D-hexose-6-phosphate mutarotase [Pseudoclavibacter endophyticus]|uniref:Putative glucose-6-phosphate 1-epimerase n=1 Tax=Pseudoclavibacter endophyticus TaxID=1778590 RepID=A0A6H9WM97_9MICO|nr:D-hexose-6-phosphate mutarotase [Pseudoclavibacter endophyticus]KAB1647808.1 D-hexose-6-phosphate mutarotase [Pseudoclavibacter endophyticus]GGA73006.1 D-hexose-6-phosphate mutarotase [Pseudoclavibacter endophyticus]